MPRRRSFFYRYLERNSWEPLGRVGLDPRTSVLASAILAAGSGITILGMLLTGYLFRGQAWIAAVVALAFGIYFAVKAWRLSTKAKRQGHAGPRSPTSGDEAG